MPVDITVGPRLYLYGTFVNQLGHPVRGAVAKCRLHEHFGSPTSSVSIFGDANLLSV
jgi:hypothetical protein